MNPNGHERIWVSVPPSLLTSQGGSQGRVTVADTEYYKVNQIVSIGDPVLPYIALKVKRVNSSTEMILGPVDKSAGSKDFVDLSAYGLTSFVYAQEQPKKHPSIKEIEENTYEQEPTLAKRTVLVDKYGRIYSSTLDPDGTLRLATDTSLSIGNLTIPIQEPTDPEIINVPIALAGTDYAFTLPTKTQRFKLKIRNSKASYKIKTASGSLDYISYTFGNTFDSGEIATPIPKTMYIECTDACTVEIFCWKLP